VFAASGMDEWTEGALAGSYIRDSVIGRGRYGVAVLYQPKPPPTLEDGAGPLPPRPPVVVKEIDLEELTDKERRQTAEEARLLSSCKHDHIIRCLGSFFNVAATSVSIVLEYAAGGTLASRLKALDTTGTSLDPRLAARWMRQVTFAVGHVHRSHVLHRDIKTANIFLTADGDVKLGDFGVSRQLSDTLSMASTVCGTPYYLAPELVNGEAYSKPADVWALGCVLYEIATLRRPFAGTNIGELVYNISRVRFDSPDGRDLLDHVGLRDAEVSRVIRGMLRLLPAERLVVDDLIASGFFQRLQARAAAPPAPSSSSSPVARPLGGDPSVVRGPSVDGASETVYLDAVAQRINTRLRGSSTAEAEAPSGTSSDDSTASAEGLQRQGKAPQTSPERRPTPRPPSLLTVKIKGQSSSSDVLQFRDSVSDAARRERRRRGAAQQPRLFRHQSATGIVRASRLSGSQVLSDAAAQWTPPPMHPQRTSSQPANLGSIPPAALPTPMAIRTPSLRSPLTEAGVAPSREALYGKG